MTYAMRELEQLQGAGGVVGRYGECPCNKSPTARVYIGAPDLWRLPHGF